MATGPKIFYEFGPFRVDPEKQVLLREDQPVAITPKTFETLLILVRHSREVVSKDALMGELWPDAFVEEANLSQNIFMLRKALGDTPEDRRYIVTLPGKGYRFVAEVREVTQNGGDVVIASRSRSQMVVEQTDTAPGRTLPAPPPKAPPTRRWKYLAAIGAVVGLLVLGTLVFLRQRRPVLGEKDSVLIADFTNTTGDPVFDGTLRQGLAVQLEQSPFLSLISEDRIQQTLRLMGQPPDARLTPEIAREICERTGTAAVLDGSIASLGSQYVLGLRARNCRTGEVLAEEQVQAERKEDVLKALSQAATKFRTRLGESLTTVEQHDTPLEDATTSSLEALKAYSTARKVKFLAAGYASAVPLLKHAVEIDPNFAMAYAFLGRTYGDIGEFALSAENTSKAYQLRNHTSERERFFIDVTYHRQVTGNLQKAHQTLESWAETYPRDRDAHGLLSGFTSQGTGKYQEAIEEGKEAIGLDPDFVPGYANVASAYIYLGRPTEAEKILQQASERKLEIPDYIMLRYYIAYLKGDKAGMEREAALGEAHSGAEDWMLHAESLTLARSGQLQRARGMSRRAVDLAQQAGQRERAALFETGAAVWEALCGNLSAAKQKAREALELSKGRDVEYGTAFALAVAGDSSQAQTLANDLEKRFAEDTSVQLSYLPTLRALLALNHGEPSQAIEVLQTAVPYELAVPGIDYYFFFGGLYPAYVRGEAYLAAHHGTEAAAEFQKILDHPGIVFSDPIGLSRISAWPEPTLCRQRTRWAQTQMPRASGHSPRTKPFSPSGKTPTPTFRSWNKPKPNTPSYSSCQPPHSQPSFGIAVSRLSRRETILCTGPSQRSHTPLHQ
jgi:eukaryotic-like serine/threonine-protein kinase